MKSSIKVLLLSSAIAVMLATNSRAVDQRQVAEYIRTNLLGGDYGKVTLWMTPTALNEFHVARDVDPRVLDTPFPYPLTWLVMIDDEPTANLGHSVRW
jgi:hypothetical protein